MPYPQEALRSPFVGLTQVTLPLSLLVKTVRPTRHSNMRGRPPMTARRTGRLRGALGRGVTTGSQLGRARTRARLLDDERPFWPSLAGAVIDRMLRDGATSRATALGAAPARC